jgi:hypothetical protein
MPRALNPISPITVRALGRREMLNNAVVPVETMALCDPGGGVTRVLLPTSFDDETCVIVLDATNTAGAAALTIDGNGDTIDGAASVQIAQNGGVAVFVRDPTAGEWTQVVAPLQLDGSTSFLFRLRDVLAPGGTTTPAAGLVGVVRLDVDVGETHVMGASEQSQAMVVVTGGGPGPGIRTLRYAHPTDATAYRRNILNTAGGGDLVVSTGTGTEVTIGEGLAQDLCFDADGVRAAVTGV